jgi:hypothetical protein
MAGWLQAAGDHVVYMAMGSVITLASHAWSHFLFEWMCDMQAAGDHVVYVAFGSLASLTQKQVCMAHVVLKFRRHRTLAAGLLYIVQQKGGNKKRHKRLYD